MPLLSAKEVRNLKLSSIPLEKLRNFAESIRQDSSGSATDIIKRLVDLQNMDSQIDALNRCFYKARI